MENHFPVGSRVIASNLVDDSWAYGVAKFYRGAIGTVEKIGELDGDRTPILVRFDRPIEFPGTTRSASSAQWFAARELSTLTERDSRIDAYLENALARARDVAKENGIKIVLGVNGRTFVVEANGETSVVS